MLIGSEPPITTTTTSTTKDAQPSTSKTSRYVCNISHFIFEFTTISLFYLNSTFHIQGSAAAAARTTTTITITSSPMPVLRSRIQQEG
jgi:hypothetical protein